MQPHKIVARVHQSLLGVYERRLLIWLAAQLPRIVTPIRLTLLGFAGALPSGFSYAATSFSTVFLWLATLGLASGSGHAVVELDHLGVDQVAEGLTDRMNPALDAVAGAAAMPETVILAEAMLVLEARDAVAARLQPNEPVLAPPADCRLAQMPGHR